jgi:hypothetical protein
MASIKVIHVLEMVSKIEYFKIMSAHVSPATESPLTKYLNETVGGTAV